MTRFRGMADVQDAVIEDLRDYGPLLDWLNEPTDIKEGWPNEADLETDVQVFVAVVWDGSRVRGPRANRRTCRIQCSVVVNQSWWEATPRTNPSTEMVEIIDRCADRLDVACGTTLPGVFLLDGGGMGSGTGMEEVGDNMRATHGDWRFGWTQVVPADN